MGSWIPAGGIGDNQNIAGVITAFNSQQTAYTEFVGDLAMHSRLNQSSVTTAQSLNNNALQARDSLSGVNLDEEAANLMHFQQMYQANAKVISTADSLFATLLNSF